MYIEAIKSMQKTVSRERAGREYNNLTPDKQTTTTYYRQTTGQQQKSIHIARTNKHTQNKSTSANLTEPKLIPYSTIQQKCKICICTRKLAKAWSNYHAP